MNKKKTNIVTILALIFSFGVIAISLQSQADSDQIKHRSQSLANSVVR